MLNADCYIFTSYLHVCININQLYIFIPLKVVHCVFSNTVEFHIQYFSMLFPLFSSIFYFWKRLCMEKDHQTVMKKQNSGDETHIKQTSKEEIDYWYGLLTVLGFSMEYSLEKKYLNLKRAHLCPRPKFVRNYDDSGRCIHL